MKKQLLYELIQIVSQPNSNSIFMNVCESISELFAMHWRLPAMGVQTVTGPEIETG